VKKTLTVLTAVLLTASLAYAKPQKAQKTAGTKTHVVAAEVVSADATAKTITVKDEKGQTETVPVLGKAVDSLKTVKAGEKVNLTCEDNAKGEHTGIIAIKAAKPAAPKAK
jgi:hypothetical protein